MRLTQPTAPVHHQQLERLARIANRILGGGIGQLVRRPDHEIVKLATQLDPPFADASRWPRRRNGGPRPTSGALTRCHLHDPHVDPVLGTEGFLRRGDQIVHVVRGDPVADEAVGDHHLQAVVAQAELRRVAKPSAVARRSDSVSDELAKM